MNGIFKSAFALVIEEEILSAKVAVDAIPEVIAYPAWFAYVAVDASPAVIPYPDWYE